MCVLFLFLGLLITSNKVSCKKITSFQKKGLVKMGRKRNMFCQFYILPLKTFNNTLALVLGV